MPIQLRQRLIVTGMATLHPATDKTKAYHPLTSGVFLVKASSTLHVSRFHNRRHHNRSPLFQSDASGLKNADDALSKYLFLVKSYSTEHQL